MAKIEIKGSPEELERVATFLANNNVKFDIVNDYGNHSLEDLALREKLDKKWSPGGSYTFILRGTTEQLVLCISCHSCIVLRSLWIRSCSEGVLQQDLKFLSNSKAAWIMSCSYTSAYFKAM